MDKRIKAFLIVAAGLWVITAFIQFVHYGNKMKPAPEIKAVEKPHAPDRQSALKTHLESHSSNATREEIDARFNQAVIMLHAKEFEHALTALDRVLGLSPEMPEAYVNIGFAFIGLEKNEEAVAAFQKATDLRPQQLNAYYGLALAYNKLGNTEAAAGAMSTYLHLEKPDSPFVEKAATLLKEWEKKLDHGNVSKSQ